MKRDIKKLFSSIVILSVAFTLIDILVGFIGEKALKKLPDFGDELCMINYRLNRVKTDVVIIGSSRARHHYNTEILADSVNNYLGRNYSFYNAGIGGNFINCNTCSIESILNRYKPKLIIFETNIGGFKKDYWQKHLYKYEPFYRTNQTVKKFIDNMGWEERVKIKLNTYRFNSKTWFIIENLLRPGKTNDGYEPLYNNIKTSSSRKNAPIPNNIENEFSIRNFDNMITLCNKLHVRLIVASSPRFEPTDNNELIRSICNRHNTPYIELYNTSFFNNHPELFYDINHLNNDGATIYTRMFFEELKPYLEEL